MFNLVSNALQNAVNVVSPPLSSDQEFKWHCDIIKEYFTNKNDADNLKLIEDTQIPKHLNEMMRLLLDENQKFNLNSNSSFELAVGFCMECMLKNKILELLCEVAKTDHPVGICLHVYKFITKLIKDYNFDLLNHCSILNSINELIFKCAITAAGPYETSQIEFLSIIVQKIKLNDNLINCFARHDFPLINSLLNMLSSPDSNVSTQSGELLICIVSIATDDIAKIILNRTDFLNKLTHILDVHYALVSESLDLNEIELAINLNQDFPKNEDNKEIKSFHSVGVRKFVAFFKWFCFIDTLLKNCKSILFLNQLSDFICENFFNKTLSNKLFFSSSINVQISSTILICGYLKNFKCNLLKEKIVNSLLDEKEVEFEGKFYNKRKIILDRCRININQNNLIESKNANLKSINFLINMYTLQFLEEIFNKPSKEIVEKLIISNLINRNYLDINLYDINNDLTELEDLNKLSNLTINKDVNKKIEKVSILNNSAIQSIKYFIAVIPNELKSCVNEEFGFQPYIIEAQKKFDECLNNCESWNWPKEVVEESYFEDENLIKSKDEEIFKENDFISMLFDNLENIVDIPYILNLQITSLITKVSLFPHPNLNEYFLNPSLPIKKSCRSLFSILHQIVDKLQVLVLGVKDLKNKLKITRNYLLGENKNFDELNLTIKDEKILEAIIIVEEFCKELAAVGFVKNNYLN